MAGNRSYGFAFSLITTIVVGSTQAMAQEVVVLKGHKQAVTQVAFSPDGKTLASASLDNTVKLWDVVKKNERATLEKCGGNIVYSQDGKYLVTRTGDNTVRLWDAAGKKVVREFTVKKGVLLVSMAISPDGKTLAAGGTDKVVTLWEVATGKQLGKLTGQRFQVLCVAFSPNGKLLAWPVFYSLISKALSL